MDSLFAYYDGELFDEFGILLLNTAEWNDCDEMDEVLEDELAAQMSLNQDRLVIGGNLFRSTKVEVETVGYYSAIAKDGELFARSVLDYMKYRIPVSLTADILEMLNLLEEGKEAKENLKEQEAEGDLLLESESENLDEALYEEYEELADEGVLGKIEDLRENGYIALILPSNQVISSKTTRKSGFPSNYFSGVSLQGNNLLREITNNILYCEYLLEYFSDFTKESKNTVLEYELEYILYGNASDKKNLEECINNLLMVREGLNIIAIYRDQALKVQAEALAASLIGWTGIPALVEVVKLGVIGAWAYAESIVDVRTLLSGHPVPFMKNQGEWTLELNKVPELIKGAYLKTAQYDDGALYQDYLRLLLLLTDEHFKYYRTMDMVQCRVSAQKPRFYMNECLYALEIEVRVEAKPLFLGMFGTGGQELKKYIFKKNAVRMY